MKWMKFTDFEGDTVWLNMERAERFYWVTEQSKGQPGMAMRSTGEVKTGTRVVFSDDYGISVGDTPEEIIARGEWTVK